MGFKIRSLWQAVAWGLSVSVTAFAAGSSNLDVPAGDLGLALSALAKQADVELVFRQEEVEGLRTKGLRGTYPAAEAVSLLLKGTRLQVYEDASGAMVVAPVGKTVGEVMARNTDKVAEGEGTQAPEGMQEEKPKLEEVVVTAQKRIERMQDVPIPMTVIDPEALLETHQTRVQDYFATIPGITILSAGNGGATIAIRGLTTGIGNPTVAVTVDDVPYGSSSTYGDVPATAVPDIDPSELARVEVLRGPQGTLYGASSIGGLVKYVTLDPSTQVTSGRLQADLDSVQNGPTVGYSLRGAADMPLSDTLAFRVGGFTRRDPGYIDNILTGEQGVNRVDVVGGRIGALWRPAENFSLKLNAILQDTKGYGSQDSDPALGDLRQTELPGTGGFHTRQEFFGATLKGKLGNFDVISATGYNVFKSYPVRYDSFGYYGITEAMFGVNGSLDIEEGTTNSFTQEIRLSTSLGRRLDWLMGAFYTYQDSSYHQLWYAAYPTTGVVVPNSNFLDGTWPTTFAEYAAFADLTLHITSRFEVQLGGRESRNRQTYSEVDAGGYAPILLGIRLL